MRQKVEDKLSTVSVNFFEKIKLSDVLLKVDKDVSAVKQCGITSIITLVSNIVNPGGCSSIYVFYPIRELPYPILFYLSVSFY